MKELLEAVKQLIQKVKELKEENRQLKDKLISLDLTDDQKKEIENLLLETKRVLQEEI